MAYNYQDKTGLVYLMSKLKTWIDNNLVRKEAGKSLTTNDFDNTYKSKLDGIEANANNYTLPTASAIALGGVKVGQNLTIDENGVLNAQDGGVKAYADLTGKPKINSVEINGELSLNDLGIQESLVFNTAYNKDSNKVATMTDVNSAVGSVYRPKGSINFNQIPTNGMTEGDVYDIRDAFTTDARFVEGAGKEYMAGTNIVWTVDNLWDILAGAVDTSAFVKATDMVAITTDEIDTMFSSWT